ncbi:alginate O-acetyltransferase AlgF [Deinococcus aquatilis]|uniref:alginate O-acetyltransferase AlgF n=1 Tax=Deinococcus aquatilis TaxID=519440 RepID=UPI000A044673|nr:alginate O-acetyltransferase AlgF [Deinococcus aquatilis]
MRKMGFVFVLMAMTTSAAQGLDSLYAPAPPANSAFVRVLNATAVTVDATISNKVISVPKFGVGDYLVIPRGNILVSSKKSSATFSINEGKFYSAIWNGRAFKMITDVSHDNRAKALLIVYNMSSFPGLDLKTADGQLAIVTKIPAGESGSRAVNGITVDLAAFNGNKMLTNFKGVSLERGKAYSIVITDAGSSLTVNTTAK